MYELFIGNYERVIGVQNAYIEKDNKFIKCMVAGYVHKSRKYQVITEDGKTFNVRNVYLKRKVN